MGQYHYVVNWDKQEILNPHRFGDGLKLLEFGCSNSGTLLGLTVLLASSNQGGARGGGDLHPWHGGPGYEGRENPVIVSDEYEQRLMDHVVGRWAGDRISVLGDYHTDDEIYGPTSPWVGEGEGYTDISQAVLQTICLDYYTRKERYTFAEGEYVPFRAAPLLDKELVLAGGAIPKRTED